MVQNQSDLAGVAAQASHHRQVLDLPPLQLLITEHPVATVCCPACQPRNSAVFPPEVADFVQYGPPIKALARSLRSYLLLPSARTSELLTDLFGTTPSEGTLDHIVQEASRRLAALGDRIRQALSVAGLIHVDETGCYVADKRWWLHVACTTKLTLYWVHRSRGHQGSAAAGGVPAFHGVAVHDAYAPYWEYRCQPALCGAPILRALLALQ